MRFYEKRESQKAQASQQRQASAALEKLTAEEVKTLAEGFLYQVAGAERVTASTTK
jgi:hypothetical protein